jgi:hypothetical protein
VNGAHYLVTVRHFFGSTDAFANDLALLAALRNGDEAPHA